MRKNRESVAFKSTVFSAILPGQYLSMHVSLHIPTHTYILYRIPKRWQLQIDADDAVMALLLMNA